MIGFFANLAILKGAAHGSFLQFKLKAWNLARVHFVVNLEFLPRITPNT
jgi:hypothetical protein